MRVVLVDDHAAMRGVIGMTIETAGEMEVVGEAADGEAALRVCAATHPDVVLMDPRLPGWMASPPFVRCSTMIPSPRCSC
jgi:chemotaxis response regulator CheB